jgi:hypothetical protein
MITWSDGTTSTGTNYLDNSKIQVEEYAFECDNFADGLWCVRVYVSPYFTIMTDFFRTEDETQEFMQFVRDLLALRFPDAYETALTFFKDETK